MTLEETIQRINELYHKSQKEGLSEEEKQEQKQLRQVYIDSVKNNLRGQLEIWKSSVPTVRSRRSPRNSGIVKEQTNNLNVNYRIKL